MLNPLLTLSEDVIQARETLLSVVCLAVKEERVTGRAASPSIVKTKFLTLYTFVDPDVFQAYSRNLKFLLTPTPKPLVLVTVSPLLATGNEAAVE